LPNNAVTVTVKTEHRAQHRSKVSNRLETC